MPLILSNEDDGTNWPKQSAIPPDRFASTGWSISESEKEPMRWENAKYEQGGAYA